MPLPFSQLSWNALRERKGAYILLIMTCADEHA
jgi:hypothetical protein